MTTTLKDIAKEAGVSAMTVSRVLREEPHPMISAKTRERVLEVARRLKYRHNLHARSLRLGRSELIGLLAFHLDVSIAPLSLEAISRAVWAKGYRPLVRSAAGQVEMEQHFIKECASRAVEGLIVVHPSAHLTRQALELLLDHQIPVVSLQPLPGAPVDCVTVDRRHGAYIATKHLLELGHRRIALLHGPRHFLATAQRLQGYQDALSEYGVALNENLLVEVIGGYRGGYESGLLALQRQPRPTALVCSSDERAIGAMKAAREAGLHVPGDMAIVGCDNIEAAEFATSPLTTVAHPVEEVAQRAVALLFQRIQNPGEDLPPQTVSLKPHLVVRESCGSAPQREVMQRGGDA